jgi:hypothetical protein
MGEIRRNPGWAKRFTRDEVEQARQQYWEADIRLERVMREQIREALETEEDRIQARIKRKMRAQYKDGKVKDGKNETTT